MTAVLLGSCTREPNAAATAPAPIAAPEKPLAFPTFEPFKEARLFRMLGNDPTQIDLATQVGEARKVAGIMTDSREVAEKYAEQKPPAEAGALLQPELGDDLHAHYVLVPVAMMKLEPLWKLATWTKAQCELATSVHAFLAPLAGVPSCTFVEAAPAENQRQLESIVRWFHAQIAKPELYAAMLMTVDDGPFAGLPYETREILAAQSSVVLDEASKLELHLCREDRLPEPWVLQLVKDGALVWSRALSGTPRGGIAEAELIPESRRWDNYGYKAFMKVNWAYGKERCYLYLGPNGELRFYFLTW